MLSVCQDLYKKKRYNDRCIDTFNDYISHKENSYNDVSSCYSQMSSKNNSPTSSQSSQEFMIDEDAELSLSKILCGQESRMNSFMNRLNKNVSF